VVTANMAKAIRVISVQRGYDPRDYALVAFGGAGPLHVARLARELDIPRVLVPRHPGILCALGLLLSDLRTNYAQTRLMLAAEDALPAMSEAFEALEKRATAWFDAEGIALGARAVRRTVDMRYAGQNYELPVIFPDDGSAPALLKELVTRFERAHQQIYGYVSPEEPIQAVTFRLEAVGAVRRAHMPAHPPATTMAATAVVGERSVWLDETKTFAACPIYDRERLAPGHRLAGPAIVEQMDATTLLLPGQAASVDAHLNLIVEI
jgi:N-methylhydantoinase A